MRIRIKNRLNTLLQGLKASTKRFPVTILIAAVLFVRLIYLNEISSNLSSVSRDNFIRLNMIIGLGIPLSLCIDFIIERFFKGMKTKRIIGYIIGGGLLSLYYVFFLQNLSFVSTTRYAGLMIFLILGFIYLPRLDKTYDYEKYVQRVLQSLQISLIYSIVLFLGIVVIFFTIDQLFDVNIDGKFYYYIFLFIFLIFNLSLFLAKIPDVNKERIDYFYSKPLLILLTYIIIPLITVYTIILYIYSGKILISREWPKGLVSHLVLWYSVFSVWMIFTISPVIEENKIAKVFRTWFPKLILPILLMMFMSMGQRVGQYGITENRYYVLVLGIWTSAIMLYYSFSKSIKNIIVPITLSIIVLNSVIGPLSSFSISKWSQNNRLNSVLSEYDMIIEDRIVINPNLSNEGKREINNIIHYFNSNHSLDDVKLLADGFTTSQMEDIFGFKYNPDLIYADINGNNYFNYGIDIYAKPINIKGYEHSINLNSWNNKNINIDDLEIIFHKNKNLLEITKNHNQILLEDLNKLVMEIHELEEYTGGKKNHNKDIEDMSFEIENEDIKIKIIFTNINGNYNGNIESTEIGGLDFVLLLNQK